MVTCVGTAIQETSETTTDEIVSNGSVVQVKLYLRKHLKEPKSYEEIEWGKVVKKDDGTYWVRHKYRAKNSFGGYVIEHKLFTLDSSGHVTNVIVWE